MLFQARGETEHLALFIAAEGDDSRDLGRGIGERAGLVETMVFAWATASRKRPPLTEM